MKKEDFFEVLGELDGDIVSAADQPAMERGRRRTLWVRWGALAACLCLVVCAIAAPHLVKRPEEGASGELSPMIYVNDTIYRGTGSRQDLTGQENKLVYLGTISSKVSSSQYPKENFQANDNIVGDAVYQFGEDIYVKIDGQYWLYRKPLNTLDVDYTLNADGTYTCMGSIYKYKLELTDIEEGSQITYVILTNNKDTVFEDLVEARDGADLQEFVILAWYC